MKSVKKDNGKKIIFDQLERILLTLRRLPQKNPLAFEISKAIKSVSATFTTFDEERSELMNKYLVKGEDGNWVMKDEVIEELTKNKNSQPTVFAYIVEEGKDEKYHKEMIDLLGRECTGLKITPVDINKKSVRIDGKSEPLTNCMSDYFEVAQINFLEEIGIITGLD